VTQPCTKNTQSVSQTRYKAAWYRFWAGDTAIIPNQKIKNIMTLVKVNRPGKTLNLMEDFFNDLPAMFKDDFTSNQWNRFTPVNIKESETAYSLEVFAPGFEKSDFKINLEKNMLTVSAEKKNEVKDEKEKQVRREYQFRSFSRSFTIDDKIDTGKIDAKYVNGVLTLNLPKKEEVKESAKEISVQ
jgi:HSP20 family protein